MEAVVAGFAEFSNPQDCIDFLTRSVPRQSENHLILYRVDGRSASSVPPNSSMIREKVEMYIDEFHTAPSLLPLFLSAHPIDIVLQCFEVRQVELVVRFHQSQTAAVVAQFCHTLLDQVLGLNVPNQIKLYRSDDTSFRPIENLMPLSELCQTTTVVLFTFSEEKVPVTRLPVLNRRQLNSRTRRLKPTTTLVKTQRTK
jgi:hypothetical protein